jgi:hypothetical protein
MMDHTHIADGIALRLLLAGLVLTSGAVGALGLLTPTSHAAVGELTDGSAPHLAFPIDNVTVGAGSPLASLDGKGNDPLTAAFPIDNVTTAFPIDNVTVSGGSWNALDTDPIGWSGADSTGVDTLFRTQDMEPYGIPRSPDGLPQDMDPY